MIEKSSRLPLNYPLLWGVGGELLKLFVISHKRKKKKSPDNNNNNNKTLSKLVTVVHGEGIPYKPSPSTHSEKTLG